MKIDHIAIWTDNLERLRSFYVKYFNGIVGEKYVNTEKGFESYFLQFREGARLELMSKENIPNSKNDSIEQFTGIIHIAFSAGSKNAVQELAKQLETEGYEIVKQPRMTKDGYFQCIILDPDGNRIEIRV